MKPPTIPLPIQPENLPPVDHTILQAVAIEHRKGTTKMCQTLRGMGWSPVQAAFIEDHWSWTWIARAVVAERLKRGLAPAPADVAAALIRDTPSERLREAEAAHGPPPRPPAAPGTPIQLPPKPATTADASAYLPAAESPESQGEKL